MTAGTTRTRRDPRREATRIALIEKAEALIAELRVDLSVAVESQVSVREILHVGIRLPRACAG